MPAGLCLGTLIWVLYGGTTLGVTNWLEHLLGHLGILTSGTYDFLYALPGCLPTWVPAGLRHDCSPLGGPLDACHTWRSASPHILEEVLIDSDFLEHVATGSY